METLKAFGGININKELEHIITIAFLVSLNAILSYVVIIYILIPNEIFTAFNVIADVFVMSSIGMIEGIYVQKEYPD